MTATLLDILMIVSLGLLAGSGAGVLIGFLAGIGRRSWAEMPAKDKRNLVLLVLICSFTVMAILAWYLFLYSAV